MAISDELPVDRGGWPPEVLAAAATFASGDVVENPPYFYFADPQYAVLTQTKVYFDADYEGPEIVDANDLAPPFGVITSQTCDVGEVDFEVPRQPFVAIAPVFDGSDLDGSMRSLLKKGKLLQGMLHLPALSERAPGFWVVDLRLEVPVEKSWLVGRTPIQGFPTEADARRIAEAVCEVRKRPAWAKVVNECLDDTLAAELKALKATNKPLFVQVATEIEEIGARADSMFAPRVVQLAAFAASGHPSPPVLAWWRETSERIAQAMTGRGITVLPAEALALDQCPVTTVESSRVTLLCLSTHGGFDV
ncbi:hypothetical protein, partial [Nocardioides ferulae]|uniref:hypothetical protein n=1 Tax=Nocardioides ferulae TaxID=2340821 RepID=UPI0013DD881D